MRPDFNIGAHNGLLEQKHLDKMGQAVWLYLWFIDRQPKNTDKVLGGRPITYQLFAESFTDVPRQTYVRWLGLIKHGGYVDLLRTPKGYVVTINKPKKWVMSDVSKIVHHKQSDVSKMGSDVSKTIHPMPKNDTSNIRATVRATIRNNNTRTALQPKHEEVSKLYYDAIKTNSLPILNHNTLRIKIKQMTTEVEHATLTEYLLFMRDVFPALEIEFKPHVNTALDIYAKRKQIENIMKSTIKDQQANQSKVLHL